MATVAVIATGYVGFGVILVLAAALADWIEQGRDGLPELRQFLSALAFVPLFWPYCAFKLLPTLFRELDR